MKKKKILFCYFAPQEIDYTPTDIGYVVAVLQQKISSEYKFEIIQLKQEIKKEESGEMMRKMFIQKDVDLIERHQPHAVFLFIESVLWSSVFALSRARRIIEELHRRQSKLFIGLQSYKIQKEQLHKILDENYVNCVISGDPEGAFLYLDEILQGKYVPRVYYQKMVYPNSSTKELKKDHCNSSDNLDSIPSPYLEHVFDNYIQTQQLQWKNSFQAFLVSSRGCSFGCFYCFRSVKFEKVRYFSPKRFYDELEYLFNNFKVCRFFVLDDAFLYSKQRLREFEKEFKRRLAENSDLREANLSIMLMARPETIDREVVEILDKIKVRCIQIGLQTVNPDLQHYMKRTVDVVYFEQIREWLREQNIELHLDIIMGLPGDSIEWLRETIRYALFLDPSFLQVKQLYLNPNTLFQVEQLKYAIEVGQVERNFEVPFVIKANGVDNRYFEDADNFIMQQIRANPQIQWKYISNKNNFWDKNWSKRK